MEVEILKYLMRANALVVKKDSIKRHAWGNITVSDSAFDRKLFEVRKAVRETSEKVELKAVYGKGVVMRLSSYEEDQILLVDKEVALSRDI
jgi:DNA-binding winged helix-turn-helix (wHTH) protein